MSGLVLTGTIVSLSLSLIALISKLWGPVKNMLDLQTTQSEAIRIILRQFLIDKTDEIGSRKYIKREEIFCLTELNKSYSALNGDNAIVNRVNEVLMLPSEDSKFSSTVIK